jgi:hypothetical protein
MVHEELDRMWNEVHVIFYEHSRVEAGYHTSTVALRVVEGDESGTRYLGL